MSAIKSTIEKFVFSNAGPKLGPHIERLWQDGGKEAQQKLVAFFYPVILELSEFYGAQTNVPKLASDHFINIGLEAFQKATQFYTPQMTFRFATYAKITINEALFDACETYDIEALPTVCAVSKAINHDEETVNQRVEKMRDLFKICARFAEIGPEEARLLNRRFVDGATARALATELGICGQQVLNRADSLLNRIRTFTPTSAVEEIILSL